MLEFRNYSKSGVKPKAFVVERSFCLGALSLNWLGVIGRSRLHGLWGGRFLSIAPLQHKKSCGIRVGPDLFRLVSGLGGGSSLVGG